MTTIQIEVPNELVEDVSTLAREQWLKLLRTYQKKSRRYGFSSSGHEKGYGFYDFRSISNYMGKIILKNKAIEALDYLKKYEQSDFQKIITCLLEI